MQFECKDSVLLAFAIPFARALPLIYLAHRDAFVRDPYFTRGAESVSDQKFNSLHPYGYAADLRTRDLTDIQSDRLLLCLRQRLGHKFDVVDERLKKGAPHFHVEYKL